MITGYLLGVLTLPAFAVLTWFVLRGVRSVQVSWRRWRPTFIGTESSRANHAASLAIARRVLVVRLPGGRVLAWRSTVNHLSGEATRAFLTVLEAVDEALATAGKDELVIRDCSRDQYLSPGDLANRSAFRFTEDSP